MKRLLSISLAIVLALGLSVVPLTTQPVMAQTTIYVDASNITGPWDGTVANPYQNIQDGINAAGAGDTVQVAPGTYYENITLKSGVMVQGAGAGVTIIDSGGVGAVVTATGVDSAARLDGFTITGGGSYGIFNESSSSPMITNNTITGNNWGIRNESSSSPTITNNTITGNPNRNISNHNSSPTITNNIISGSLYGIWNIFSSPTITNNIISGNLYGIYNYDVESSPTIDYNDVWDNGTNYQDCSAGPNDISQDPLFVNPGAGDYHLQSGSPCIDAGSNSAPSLPTTDFEGDPRIWPSGGVVDMGADEYYVALVPATIDIKPGSDPNSINLKSKGVIPVAILTTPDFDATTVDALTVTFGPDAATMVHKNAHLEDVDGDGDIDMVLHFRTQETGITPGQTSATLTGETYGGTPIEGSDIIRVK